MKADTADTPKIGRPSAMTEQVVADIVNALAAGATVRAAAGAAGISERTYHSWRERGEQEGADEAFLQFLQRTTRAREQGKVALVASIRRSANEGDWRAAAWLLERLEPEAWAAKHVLEHSGLDGGPVPVDTPPELDISDPETRRLLDELLVRRASGS